MRVDSSFRETSFDSSISFKNNFSNSLFALHKLSKQLVVSDLEYGSQTFYLPFISYWSFWSLSELRFSSACHNLGGVSR